MTSHTEPRSIDDPQESEFDATDGGWDPYVTGLLAGAGAPAGGLDGEDDDGAPVMSLARVEEKRGR